MEERLREKVNKAKKVAEEVSEKTQTSIAPASEMPVTEYEDWTGNHIKLSPKIIRDYINPRATIADVAKFIAVCKTYRLNPFLGDAYLVKYDEREPAQIIVSRFSFMRVATRHENYKGFKSGVIVTRKNPDKQRSEFAKQAEQILKELMEQIPEQKAVILETILKLHELEDTLTKHEVEIMELEGAFVPPGWNLYGGWCVVYIQEPDGSIREVSQKVLLSEYNREKASWRVMPATMIQKVAEAHAFRKAFPDLLSGLYITEEMGVETNEHPRTVVATLPTQEGEVSVEELDAESTDM